MNFSDSGLSRILSDTDVLTENKKKRNLIECYLEMEEGHGGKKSTFFTQKSGTSEPFT
jgi:hypothetical protein